MISATISQIKYGSATSPSFAKSPSLWKYEGGIGMVPTAEMLSAKKVNKPSGFNAISVGFKRIKGLFA
jgi:hypothetical protein